MRPEHELTSQQTWLHFTSHFWRCAHKTLVIPLRISATMSWMGRKKSTAGESISYSNPIRRTIEPVIVKLSTTITRMPYVSTATRPPKLSDYRPPFTKGTWTSK